MMAEELGVKPQLSIRLLLESETVQKSEARRVVIWTRYATVRADRKKKEKKRKKKVQTCWWSCSKQEKNEQIVQRCVVVSEEACCSKCCFPTQVETVPVQICFVFFLLCACECALSPVGSLLPVCRLHFPPFSFFKKKTAFFFLDFHFPPALQEGC